MKYLSVKSFLTISLFFIGTLQSMTQNKRPHNPILSGFHADPEILYSQQTKHYYIYPTSDGFPGWGGSYYKGFSS